MKLEYYLESFALLITVVAFIREVINAEPQMKIFLLSGFVVIALFFVILISINYLQLKFNLIKINTQDVDNLKLKITNFEKELNIRQSLELINYKIGELEGRKR